MSPTEKVSFFSKGKKVVFDAATKGARRASAIAQKQVGYKPTPAQRKAAAERTKKGRYKPYKTPAQRKTRRAVSFQCNVKGCTQSFTSVSAYQKHMVSAHPSTWARRNLKGQRAYQALRKAGQLP